MKLKNKLIPIGTILTTAATLAPVALTSCSSNMVNLINGYRPSITKAVWEDYKADKDDMLKFYASAVNENPEIFAQDIYWGDAANALLWQDTLYQYDAYKLKQLTSKISNVAVHKRNCKDYATGTEETVVYYTMDFEYRTVEDYQETYSNMMYDTKSDRTLKLKEMPFIINKQDYDADDLGYYTRTRNYAFEDGLLPTDWVFQFNCYYDEDAEALNHDVFTNLEKNGFNWSIDYSENYSVTTTSIITNKSYTEGSEYNVLFDRDSLFDSENILYELTTVFLAYWYAPIFYLSDIVDTNAQLWPIA